MDLSALARAPSLQGRFRARWCLALVLAASAYLFLTLPLAALAGSGPQLPSLLFLLLWSVLAADIALRITESVLACCWSPRLAPVAPQGLPPTETAVLMTVCDDDSPAHLRSLASLHDAGFDVYVLDDSRERVAVPPDIAAKLVVVRRPLRTGAKAGNLNHWIRHFGPSYRFCCILDADSRMPVAALHEMQRAAAHPGNSEVAVFQAKVAPDPDVPATVQARLGGLGARARERVFARVHSPLGLLLSGGHNQLLRLRAVSSVGGFDETVTCEDTALSLRLSRLGWRTVLVDAWSYDTEPNDFEAYARRTLRWARQTAEICCGDWPGVPLRLKLLVGRHLLAYVTPLAALAALVLCVWSAPADAGAALRFVVDALSLAPGLERFGWALWSGTLALLVELLLRWYLTQAEGASRRLLPLSMVWGAASCGALAVPLAAAMLATASGRRVEFIPTGSRVATRHQRAQTLALLVTSAGATSAMLVIGAWRHPGAFFLGLAGLAIPMMALSPFLLLMSWRVAPAPSRPSGDGAVALEGAVS